jgi:uncharacterized protein (TIGR02147 family)
MGLYDHTDYRQYLQEFFADRKAVNPRYSYAVFARQAGFKTKAAMHRIVSGKRNLSKDALFKVAQAMQMDGKAFAYFQTLVAYSHAKDPGEKSFFFRKILEANPRSPAQRLREDGYEYFARWYFSTLRELLPLIRFKGDYAALGRMLRPAISAAKARKAVELLLRLGLIEKSRTGFRATTQALTSGGDATALALRDFHRQNMDLAKEAIDTVPRPERHHSCLVVSVSAEGLEILKKEIQACRQRLARLADGMAGADRICHVNFQIFPTTGLISEPEPGR